jgi:SAM-dependent methyltransferase
MSRVLPARASDVCQDVPVTHEPDALEPDTKDWTWVLDRPCGECGFEASAFDRPAIPGAFRKNAQVWLTLLADPSAAERTRPDRWSTLEYACHVHDVHQVYHERVSLMLAEDDPLFEDWDQDRSAAEGRYDEQLPVIVGPTLVAAAYAISDLYDSVPPLAWQRRGRRSNGSEFTIETLARYQLHDVVHHLHDVRDAARAATIRSYDADAARYRDATTDLPPAIVTAIGRFVGRLPAGGRVLEIGSGSGRDALALEQAGLSVRRTDITPAFADLLREAGHQADQLDPLRDDLADPGAPEAAYDGVWANASLLHVDRGDLPTVLARLARATRPDGTLFVSVKEGDGEDWSIHGNVTAPRFFTFWRDEPLRSVVDASGWSVQEIVRTQDGDREPWLTVMATRA